MSQSSSRLIIGIVILLLNPLPFLHGKSIRNVNHQWKLSHQKRQIDFDGLPPKQEILFEGLLGCKYDLDVCNEKEICVDDDLFGQCSNGESMIFKNGLETLHYNQIEALDSLFEFIQENQLDWKDYLTQCVLSHVVFDDHRQLNEEHLTDVYEDCLVKDGILNEFEDNSLQKRSKYKLPFQNPYSTLGGSYLDSTMGVPLYLQYQDQVDTHHQANHPRKTHLATNERHAGLVETSQVNTTKPLLPREFPLETDRVFLIINRNFKDPVEGAQLLAYLAHFNSWPIAIFTGLNTQQNTFTFRVIENAYGINASTIVSSVLNNPESIEKELAIRILDAGVGSPLRGAQLAVQRPNGSGFALLLLVTGVLLLFIVVSFLLCFYSKRSSRIREKFSEITEIKTSSTSDYEDVCRQPIESQKRPSQSSSTRTSTSSTTEEPLPTMNMDIMTGHLILSYMEDHLRNRHRLESEWQALNLEKPDEQRCSVALAESNEKKNRYFDCIPYDHTRIRLRNDYDDEDYINASKITDSGPRCKYIATQGPLPNTTNAFWEMVWEQGSSVIVALSRPIENGMTMCHHYWPVDGSAQFHDFEVNLISEHIWSDDYVVRSFYLRNLQTMETRTVTQFHYLTWDELSNPPSVQSMLDFRRKVNKCFRARSSPLIVHCNDGVGRTGTYILLDIVLNRIARGAREINIAATLEHIRDQRAKMVKTKEQFEFVFAAVAEEVSTLLKSPPQ